MTPKLHPYLFSRADLSGLCVLRGFALIRAQVDVPGKRVYRKIACLFPPWAPAAPGCVIRGLVASCCCPSLLGLALLAGCTDGKSSVTGTVTFDDQPVRSGSITFVRTEGELVREGAVIQNGEFHAAVPPGQYKIELNAQKVVSTRTQKGFDGAEEVVEITEELFPARYNTNTELNEVIKPGSNTLKLDLKSSK
jgi:hypothetical protein